MKKILITIGFILVFESIYSKTDDKRTLIDQLVNLNNYWNGKKTVDPIYDQIILFKTDVDLIQFHLSLVEKNLRATDISHLSIDQKERRNKCLNLLNQYWKNGVFPKNIHHQTRTPYFIDHLGTPCAVGALLINTGYESIAKKISTESNYAYVKEIKNRYPVLIDWAKLNGFTIDELAWIQPGYESDPFYMPIICDSTCTKEGAKIKSTFVAADSVVLKYKSDAEHLALNWINKNNLHYKDSIEIPKEYIDTFLKPLIALYNSTSKFTPRDTVVKMIEIHTKMDSVPSTNDFYITTAGKQSNFEKLKNGSKYSGESILDSLIAKNGVYFLERHDPYSFDPQNYIYHFKTDNAYNMAVLTSKLSSINGVEKVSQYFDGYIFGLYSKYKTEINIFSIDTDYVQLHYFYSWTCETYPCKYRPYSSLGRYWVFNVYHDSTVEFVKSYGSPLEAITYPKSSVMDISQSEFNIFPNPFNDIIHIEGIVDNFSYSISDILGKEIMNGNSKGKSSVDLERLKKGQYTFKMILKDHVITKHILKN